MAIWGLWMATWGFRMATWGLSIGTWGLSMGLLVGTWHWYLLVDLCTLELPFGALWQPFGASGLPLLPSQKKYKLLSRAKTKMLCFRLWAHEAWPVAPEAWLKAPQVLWEVYALRLAGGLEA